MTKRVVLAGGTGLLGRMLAKGFRERGYNPVIVSRRQLPNTVPWEALDDVVDGADVVINLAGRNVNCRYTPEHKRDILESRVQSTAAVSAAIRTAIQPPRVWLQMSTATIYAHRYFTANDEVSGILGGEEAEAPAEWRFSTDVAKAWESAATLANSRTRLVLLRSAMVMAPEHGSAFDMLAKLVRIGLGGSVGDGRQFVSWIHHRDFVRAVVWLAERNDLSGVVNLAAPNPLPNADFMRELRESYPRRFGLPLPESLLTLGARLLRTEPELVLKSRRVIPGRLLLSGFTFDFESWKEAARDLCTEWRSKRDEKNVRTVRLLWRSMFKDADAHRY